MRYMNMKLKSAVRLPALASLVGVLGATPPSLAQQNLQTPKIITLSWIGLNPLLYKPFSLSANYGPDYFSLFSPVKWSDAEKTIYTTKISPPKLLPVW